jgi:hypothetical protein
LSPRATAPVPAALPRFTARFEMDRGGSVALLAHPWSPCCPIPAGWSRDPSPPALPHTHVAPAPPAAPTGRPGKPSRLSARPLHPSPGVHGAPVLTARLAARLPVLDGEVTRLVAGFALRCFQRFALPTVATQAASRLTPAPPAGRPARSSRTRASPTQSPTRPHRIETELSHDVLNPARVPLSWANSPTLGTDSSPRMRRADIEVPNPAVDLNSWAGSACYPRGSFYPVRYGASTCHRRITTPCFRTCAGCVPCSQAPLCRCTPWVVAIHPEGTVGRLRYALGGDRPSQTPHQPGFHSAFAAVRVSRAPEWYFTVASTPPASGASPAPTYPTQSHDIPTGKLE